TIYAHCYMDAEGEIEMSAGKMKLKQETGYPYDGKIRILTETEATCEIALHLPSWSEQWKLTINGKEAEARGPEDAVFWNDALHRDEPQADHPFCQTGSPELV